MTGNGDPKGLGWRLATFMLDVLQEAQGHDLESSELFMAYEAWCDQRGEIPYLEGVFVEQFCALCDEVGIEVDQSGSNVALVDVALKVGAKRWTTVD